MTIEFNDVRLQYESLKSELDQAVGEVLAGGQYILGPSVEAFEQEFAQFCGAADAVGVASGTDALIIALRALGIRTGDEVLVPAVSAAATAMAVVSVGATPVFVDISASDFTMDPESAEQNKTRSTKAAVPVHLYGMPAPLDDLAKKLHIPLIEDAAQAHGSAGPWGMCGSFGVAAAFSFYPTKNLGAYGDGGMVVTSEAKIAEQARLLRNYGQREQYSSDIFGVNSRLDELHAAMLRIKLKKLEEWNRKRRQIAARYREGLRDLPLTMQAGRGSSNYHLFVVLTPQRDQLRIFLASRRVPTLIHYPVPLHVQPAFAQFNRGGLPNAERLSSSVLSLPIHAHMSPEDADYVIGCIRDFFKR